MNKLIAGKTLHSAPMNKGIKRHESRLFETKSKGSTLREFRGLKHFKDFASLISKRKSVYREHSAGDGAGRN